MTDDWRIDAACTQVDPEIFFPDVDDWRVSNMAKKVCATCTVRADCLKDTPASDRWSIRAGMTAEERRTHRARRPQRP